MDSGKEITADGIKDIKRVQPKKTTKTSGKEHNLFKIYMKVLFVKVAVRSILYAGNYLPVP